MFSLAIYLFREPVLLRLGSLLVEDDGPAKADAVVVLGGDYEGHRVLAAAKLVHEGYAPYLVVSGTANRYGLHEVDLAINYAKSKGFTDVTYVPVYHSAISTVDEAKHDIPELRRRGVHTLLMVTSPSHTRRAKGVFRQMAPEIQVRAVISPDPVWHHGRWWIDREGRKYWFFAAFKSIADYLGI